MDAISKATSSVDNVVRRGGTKVKVKKTPSTSSGSQDTENKAKNFYDRMSREHQQMSRPTTLKEARHKYKADK
jgi:hypothetical protein